mmetsp:Transcript_27154/g.63076  ORF Transcript_27154/g.63076 Transcript_27154/m.63076 type:complete len:153 (-) Transcript_27154:85-543(-)
MFIALSLLFLSDVVTVPGLQLSFRRGVLRPTLGENKARVIVTSKVGPASAYVPVSGEEHANRLPGDNATVMTVSNANRLKLENNPNVTVEEDARRFRATDSHVFESDFRRGALARTQDAEDTNRTSQQFSHYWGYRAVQVEQVHEMGVRGQS